ncbi:predicted Zn-dependent protease [Buchnera aphidicola (Cinara tujafilina)]|uniref:Predicted Zn-dependent protease n=1 Tax=Buchnera aphidicola (Cinara tujafilina) TaxID=261317 RepID=F7WZI0_9GAMM|nr:metalloprotease TldD [Buchnera aphidicola]AEH39844.1 predicted Zn-dependent protease [Buchnera aphidicola (Cinara tujafilina)]
MLKLVSNILLYPNNIYEKDIVITLDKILSKKIDFGDIYFQLKKSESWILENKIIKKGTLCIDEGFGIRTINHSSTAFSYSNCINLNNIQKVSNIVCDMLPIFPKTVLKKAYFSDNISYYSSVDPIEKVSIDKKINLLHMIDNIARKQDPRVVNVNAVLNCEHENILVASTDCSHLSADIRPLIYISISVVVESNGQREKGYSGGGGRFEFSYFFEKHFSGDLRIEYWTKEAVRIALVALFSKPAPAGLFSVVLGSGWPGVLFHEAVGHGLEGDFIRKKTSLFTKKKGQKVASELCTIVDNGTLKNLRGSINIDDEGVPSQKNILIENGILKSFLQDKINANLMNTRYTGNGRRQSYAHLPMPRMTNTYLMPRKMKHEDIIESVNNGIYAVNFSGGQVDITSGNFVFSAAEAYIIQNGKIKYPIKGVTLIGSGIKTMNLISMVGNNLKMDDGIGFCGKEGQNIPVCVGQPTVKVDSLTVGGTVTS